MYWIVPGSTSSRIGVSSSSPVSATRALQMFTPDFPHVNTINIINTSTSSSSYLHLFLIYGIYGATPLMARPSSITTSNKNTTRSKKLPASIGPGILRTNFADGHPTSPNLQPAWLLSASICIHYIDFLHNSRYCLYLNWPNFHHHQSTWLSLFSSFAISFQISPTNIQQISNLTKLPSLHQSTRASTRPRTTHCTWSTFHQLKGFGKWQHHYYYYYFFLGGGHLIDI